MSKLSDLINTTHSRTGHTHMFNGVNCTESEFDYLSKLFNEQVKRLLTISKEEIQQALTVRRAAEKNQERPEIKKEPEISSSVEATLAQRGSRYGDFTDHARICQDLKEVMVNSKKCMPDITTQKELHYESGWDKLSPVQKQALEVIADKIARILSGDPNYDDNWHDIQGYAKLVEDRLPCNQKKES